MGRSWSNASRHHEILEYYGGHKCREYDHYVKKKNKYGHHPGDFFDTFMDMENAVLDFQSHQCALCECDLDLNPLDEASRGQGKNYRGYELDHDHLLFEGTLGCCRGYLCKSCNGFLKKYDSHTDVIERAAYMEKWYGKHVIEYLTHPPFQEVLRRADGKFYRKMKKYSWDPEWWKVEQGIVTP